MENTERTKWIDWLASINFARVNLEAEDTQKGVIAKFRRFVGPQDFDEKFKEREDVENWFYIELMLYEDQISYGIVSENFDRRDESRVLGRIVEPAFTKATGDLETMEKAISEMAEKLDFLINYPTEYIKNKLEEFPV